MLNLGVNGIFGVVPFLFSNPRHEFEPRRREEFQRGIRASSSSFRGKLDPLPPDLCESERAPNPKAMKRPTTAARPQLAKLRQRSASGWRRVHHWNDTATRYDCAVGGCRSEYVGILAEVSPIQFAEKIEKQSIMVHTWLSVPQQ